MLLGSLLGSDRPSRLWYVPYWLTLTPRKRTYCPLVFCGRRRGYHSRNQPETKGCKPLCTTRGWGELIRVTTYDHYSASLPQLITNTRYKESSAKIGTTGPLEEPTTSHAVTDGALDVDLAELSLGQRLRISKGDEGALSDSDFSTTSVERGESKIQASKQKRALSGNTNGKELRVPTTSLAQTLTQALHSSDTSLLEACFAHTDRILIMNTVRRIPPQLALVLLDACVERLGRGRKGNAGTGQGRGAGVGSQRGAGLVRWMKSVLVVHGGSLMSVRVLSQLTLLEADQGRTDA